jgi:recombination protein RecA
MSPEMKANLDMVLSAIKKTYGKGSVMKLTENATVEPDNVISSGSIALDSALGIGGYRKGRIVEIYGPESSGKAQPLTANVLTPNGWVQMGNLKVGDLVCTPDGKSAPILGIYPQGETPVYQITFSDGAKTECSGDHLWLVQTWDDKQKNLWRTMTTLKLIQDYKTSSRLKYMIPVTDTLDLSDNYHELELDPYILGLLLGDGSFRNATIRISTGDQEILNTITKFADDFNMSVNHVGGYDYSISKGRKGKEKPFIRQVIESLGLFGLLSQEKFVPKQYLIAPSEARLSLLQGLMDTDGSVNSGTPEFVSTSKQLADAVVYIVRSLGGRANISTKKTHYPYKGNCCSGLEAYRVSIVMPQGVIPFRLSRKSKQLPDKTKDFNTRWIKEIKGIGIKPTQCIYIDSPDHLYITDDFIVTHNTTLTLHAIANTQRDGGVCAFIDTEHALDPMYAKNLGVDISQLIISQPDFAEQALGIVDMLARSGEVKLIVLDSVAALVPQKELEGDIGDYHVGTHARLMSQAMRKLTGIVHQTGCTMMFVNQIRMKIGVRFGSPETTTGGNALKFYASQRLDIRRIGQIKSKETIIGNKTKVKIVKNKLAPPFKEAEFDIRFGIGVDRIAEIVDLGIEDGIVKKSGTWFSLSDGTRLGQGRDNAIQFMKENPDVTNRIEQELIENRGLDSTIEEDKDEDKDTETQTI